MTIGIVIPTYRKPDGSTKIHLERALRSIKNQVYQDYKVILVGDQYEDQNELIHMSKIIDEEKITVINLPRAIEREKYRGRELWVCGGCNANNIGIEMLLSQNVEYICSLDHDDWYFDDHLELLNETIQKKSPNFITTKCGKWPSINGIDNQIIQSTEFLIDFVPLPSKIFKVSTCINFGYYNFRFRNMVEEFGKVYASDADMWYRISQDMMVKGEFGVLINKQTCGRGSSQTVLNYY
jgi:glycosyltransferase involved in cell wall biosynthesis